MRELTDHKISKLNRENILVEAVDDPDVDGANHEYRIRVQKLAETSEQQDEVISITNVKFQKGGLADVGVNGLTDQALLAIVLDRMRGFQSGPYSCRDNAIAITKMEEALMWMGRRYADRATRGVEGQRVA
jgi:hypothetical protein